MTDGGSYSQLNSDHFFVGYGQTGQGLVVVDGVDALGNASSINVLNRIEIGNFGKGELQILNGGFVKGGYTTFVASNANSTGYVLVKGVHSSGIRSTFTTANNNLQIADGGTGTVDVLDGALASAPQLITVGYGSTGKGVLNVDGVHAASGLRSTATAPNVWIAGSGIGELNILNGGQVIASTALYAGRLADGKGVINIRGTNAATGDRSYLESDTLSRIGYSSEGYLNILNGGYFNSRGITEVGTQAGGIGAIHVDGKNSLGVTLNKLDLGLSGQGTLTVTNDGLFRTPSIILASQAGSKGTINIGDGGNAGTLETSTIEGGLGDAEVNFNHIGNITFSPQLTGNININHINSGYTQLTANNNYTGRTTVNSGTLAAGGANLLSENSSYKIGQQGRLALQDYNQRLLHVDNAGTLIIGDQTAGNTLYVTEDYIGSNGTLQLNAVLGNDASLTDRLIIERNATGSSSIVVKNVGGAGAQTSEGIEIVRVLGGSNAQFQLSGDYKIDNGKDVVVAGAYAYQLEKGNRSGTETSNWYLRSELNLPSSPSTPSSSNYKPLYQAGVPIYEAYPQFLLGLNRLTSLQQRVGSRNKNGTGINGGDSALKSENNHRGSGPNDLFNIGDGSWGRIEKIHTKLKPSTSTSDTHYDYDVFKLQMGYDNVLSNDESGKLIGGFNAHFTQGKAHVNSLYGQGSISTKGYGLGATLTWLDNNNFYIDNQIQATHYNSDLYSRTANRTLVKGNKGIGYALSTEFGKRFFINQEWSLTPQIQLSYSNVSFRTFDDTFNAIVSSKKSHSLLSRIGSSANYHTANATAYVALNVLNEFLNGTETEVSNIRFKNKNDRLWGSLDVGGSYSWDKGRLSIYGEASLTTGLRHFGDSYGYQGIIGVRAHW